MKKITLSIFLLLTTPTLVAPTSNKQPEVIPVKTEVVKNMDLFLNDLGHQESGNRYDIVNRFGYMGRYQFGRATLKGLGIDVTKEEFINDHRLQERAMHMLLLHNKKKLKRYIKKYEGQIIHGILVTESGILAAAHLAGQGNVRKFLKNGFVFEDGNGTKMTSYMKQFGGYILNL